MSEEESKKTCICPKCGNFELVDLEKIVPAEYGWGMDICYWNKMITINVPFTDLDVELFVDNSSVPPKTVQRDSDDKLVLEDRLAVLLALPKQVEAAIHDYLSSVGIAFEPDHEQCHK